MSRIGSWLRGSANSTLVDNGPQLQRSQEEEAALESAMNAATMIMNDDVEGADKQLMLNDSSFHLLGRGIIQFMRSLLGFEQEIMKQAADRLYAAENKAWDDMKRAQKNSARTSQIYSSGSEFALCYAQAQLMSAVVAVLNENLTESIKGFYKLRKAYQTLDQLKNEEDAYIRKKLGGGSSKASLGSIHSSNVMPGAFAESAPQSKNASSIILNATSNQNTTGDTKPRDDDDDSDLEFVDADESLSGTQTPANYNGYLATKNISGNHTNGVDGLVVTGANTPQEHSENPESSLFASPVDAFIHSGTNLCYGLLLLILSMVPPAFSRLLSIIGFKGDRERGLTLLWKSCNFKNINGAVSGLVLLSYYNGLTGFCDILPDPVKFPDDNLGYPRKRCEELLNQMRSRYPESRLWRLEEARMQLSKRELNEAISILNSNNDSKLKQITALNMFEKGLGCLYAHEYLESARCFEACMELNSWSHCLYTYIIACCHIELYRNARGTNDTEAHKWKVSAIALLKDAPTHAGKKKFMAKQLPFDVFVARKLSKWEQRAREWDCDVVDAVGISPVEEMIYLWNGSKRMPPQQLEKSLAKLSWSEATFPDKHEGNVDESGLRALLRAALIRNQGNLDEARTVLQEGILKHDKSAFTGHLKDDWSCPAGHYEMAVLAWLEKDLLGADESAKLAECEEWLGKVSRWEGYVLDARIGLKITTANDTLKRYKQLKSHVA